MKDITYTQNHSSFLEIVEHLKVCDHSFIPTLSSRVDLNIFAKKLKDRAVLFEAWHHDLLIGLVSAYFNNLTDKISFINNVSVHPSFSGKGIASKLIENALKFASETNFYEIQLEVFSGNRRAIKLYENKGFTLFEDGDYLKMRKRVEKNT